MAAIEQEQKVPIITAKRSMACPEANMFKFIAISNLEDQVRKFFKPQANSMMQVEAEHKVVPSFKRPWDSTQDNQQVNKKTNLVESWEDVLTKPW